MRYHWRFEPSPISKDTISSLYEFLRRPSQTECRSEGQAGSLGRATNLLGRLPWCTANVLALTNRARELQTGPSPCFPTRPAPLVTSTSLDRGPIVAQARPAQAQAEHVNLTWYVRGSSVAHLSDGICDNRRN